MDKEKMYIERDSKGLLDRALNKLVSRKLTVWTTFLVLLTLGMVDATSFLYVSLVYISSEAAANIVKITKGA